MALKVANIRFAPATYDALRAAAGEQGISVSQYVREAALIRLVLDELDREHDAPGAIVVEASQLLALAREVRRLSTPEASAT
jgi:hypothetical protein